MNRKFLLVLALLGGASLVLLFCCSATERPEPRTDAPASAPSSEWAAAPASALPGEPGTGRSPAPPAAASAPASPARAVAGGGAEPGAPGPASATGGAGPGSLIASTVRTNDPRDLELLSSIERELRRDPPSEVHALIRRRKEGATRAELEAGARALADLRLRVLALRWLDEVMPAAPSTGSSQPAVPGATSSTPRFVKPIEPSHAR